jgi:hypothetical protein
MAAATNMMSAHSWADKRIPAPQLTVNRRRLVQKKRAALGFELHLGLHMKSLVVFATDQSRFQGGLAARPAAAGRLEGCLRGDGVRPELHAERLRNWILVANANALLSEER